MNKIRRQLNNLGLLITSALWLKSFLKRIFKSVDKYRTSIFYGNKEDKKSIIIATKKEKNLYITLYDLDKIHWVKLEINIDKDEIKCIDTDPDTLFWKKENTEERVKLVNDILKKGW